jgi:hypothetical protein
MRKSLLDNNTYPRSFIRASPSPLNRHPFQ